MMITFWNYLQFYLFFKVIETIQEEQINKLRMLVVLVAELFNSITIVSPPTASL